MPNVPVSYISSIQVEHFHRTLRFHWMICSAKNPDTLVSWGHAPTRELAEAAVQGEIQDLLCGRTTGGQVRDVKKIPIHRP